MDSSFISAGSVLDNVYKNICDNIEKNSDPRTARALKTISPIEEKMRGALQRFGVNPESQKQIGPYFADLYISDGKIVIECDGEEFHKDKEKDKKRDLYMRNQGYNVIRYPGWEIVRNPIDCAYFIVGCIGDAEIKYPRFKEYSDRKNRENANKTCKHCGLVLPIEIDNCNCDGSLLEDFNL